MMMMPPNTILEMQKFMHDELHGAHTKPEMPPNREHRVRRIVGVLFRRYPPACREHGKRDLREPSAV